MGALPFNDRYHANCAWRLPFDARLETFFIDLRVALGDSVIWCQEGDDGHAGPGHCEK
jgi:hypothetical protein